VNYVAIKHRVLTGLRSLRFSAFEMVGDAGASGGQLRVLFAGSESFRHYLKELAFDGIVEERHLGRTTPWQLHGDGRHSGYDLLISRSHRALADMNFFRGSYFVPEWLSGKADLEAQWRRADTSKSRKRDLRQLDKHRLRYRVTTDPTDLGFFFEQMYVPHIRRAHGPAALLMGYDQMMSRTRRGEGELVLISRDGQPVAGSFIVYDAGKPRLFSEGVLHSNKDYLRMGAGTALYLYSFDHLRRRGFRWVNMGRSRAFLSDGVLYFKERFGVELTEPSDSGVFVQVLRLSPATRAFLDKNPFVHVRGRRLRGCVLTGELTACGKWREIAMHRMRRLGVDTIDVIDGAGQRTSNVSVAHCDS
jgi:hypothetical protein